MAESLPKYKAFIDDLVERAQSSVKARHCLEGGFRASSADAKYNELLSTLSGHQRELLSELVLSERRSSIHDVLVYLTDSQVELAIDGERLAREPFDTESYFDFVARAEGDPWPDEK